MSMKRITTFAILIAAVLIGVIFFMSDSANAAVAAPGAVIGRPASNAQFAATKPFVGVKPNVAVRPNVVVNPKIGLRPFIQPFFRPVFNPFFFDEEALFFGAAD